MEFRRVLVRSGQPERATTLFEDAPRRAVDESIDDEAGILGDFLKDALEMGFGAHHRPEVTDRLDIVILRKRGLGDVLQRLAGRIGQQMEMQPHYGHRSVENMPAPASATYTVRQASGSLRKNSRSSTLTSKAHRSHHQPWTTHTNHT